MRGEVTNRAVLDARIIVLELLKLKIHPSPATFCSIFQAASELHRTRSRSLSLTYRLFRVQQIHGNRGPDPHLTEASRSFGKCRRTWDTHFCSPQHIQTDLGPWLYGSLILLNIVMKSDQARQKHLLLPLCLVGSLKSVVPAQGRVERRWKAKHLTRFWWSIHLQ